MTEQRGDPPSGRPADASPAVSTGHAPELPSHNGVAARPSRIEELEAELADWQRRAVLWRERALSAQSLNEALTANLEDLRTMLPPRAGDEPDVHEVHDGTIAPVASTPVPLEPWWNKVFRRETWRETWVGRR